jgi:hypothetical protein
MDYSLKVGFILMAICFVILFGMALWAILTVEYKLWLRKLLKDKKKRF